MTEEAVITTEEDVSTRDDVQQENVINTKEDHCKGADDYQIHTKEDRYSLFPTSM